MGGRVGELFLVMMCLAVMPGLAGANPYCISGSDWSENDVLSAIGMPPESEGYHWGQALPSVLPQMCRPCKTFITTCRFNSYHEDTDTFEDQAALQQYVLDNPGKVWIIGNEPNLASQDGLTREQYAAMYSKYYHFIKPLDPAARFAVGAVSGDAVPGHVDMAIEWWEGVMSIYKANTGEATMPVDVWNYHCYAPPWQRDVEDYMDIYVTPFTNWVRTVEGGAYSGAEIWVTEFSIAYWRGPLNARWIEPWMHRVCLRLEQSEVSRWFWLLGPWDTWSVDGRQQQTALIDSRGDPTILGETYVQLANNYPNTTATPKPDPTPLAAPDVFTDDFDDGDMSDWIDKAGPWKADGSGGYVCETGPVPLPWTGTWTQQPYVYEDFTVETRVKINSAPEDKYWAGIKFRFEGMFGWEWGGREGWVAFLRQNGNVELDSGYTPSVEIAPGAVADTSVYHDLRVDVGGVPMQVDAYVDGERVIHYFDMDVAFPQGFVALETGKSNSTFDDVRITNRARITPEAENGDFEAGDIANATPWMEWQAATSNSVSHVYERSGANTGRNGSVGLRVTTNWPSLPFNAGIRRSIAGARPGIQYQVEAWIRCNTSAGGNLWGQIGIDPTGQVEDEDASTIEWSDTPATTGEYVRVFTPGVMTDSGRIALWFRAGTNSTIDLSVDVDDIVLHAQEVTAVEKAAEVYE
jgi:hypothetical protein